MRMSGHCDTTALELEVFDAILFSGSDTTLPAIESMEPLRIGPVVTPFVLHTIVDDPLLDCLTLDIRRVVSCAGGNCGFNEYTYALPCEDTGHALLPAGMYDIYVCKQSVIGYTAGDIITLDFLIEAVTDSFAAIYGQKGKC